MASPFTYYGGKQRLAPELVRLLPDAQVYVEVFGGAAAVLFERVPRRDVLEVYNDVDDHLVRFMRVLRDRPADLVRALQLSPYSRAEFEAALAWLGDPVEVDEVEAARRFYVAVSQARGGVLRGAGWAGARLGLAHTAHPFTVADKVDRLHVFAERLRRVQVERLDWRACLDRYDAPGACLYVDPPYMPSTRSRGGSGYRHELTVDDHADLVARLLTLDAAFVVSGYDHEVYRPLDEAAERLEFRQLARSSGAAAMPERVEVVWRRFAVGQVVQERLAL